MNGLGIAALVGALGAGYLALRLSRQDARDRGGRGPSRPGGGRQDRLVIRPGVLPPAGGSILTAPAPAASVAPAPDPWAMQAAAGLAANDTQLLQATIAQMRPHGPGIAMAYMYGNPGARAPHGALFDPSGQRILGAVWFGGSFKSADGRSQQTFDETYARLRADPKASAPLIEKV